MPLHYNETELIQVLNRLPVPLRVAFAALCAERLLPVYVAFCTRTHRRNAAALQSLVERIWKDLNGEPMGAEEVQAGRDAAMALIPTEDEGPWVELQAQAEDAAAAVAYALRTRQSGQSEEAAWAARRAYEALDHYVINRDRIDTNVAGAEQRVVGDPLVQAELSRQRHDLDDLLQAADSPRRVAVLEELRARARTDASRFLGAHKL